VTLEKEILSRFWILILSREGVVEVLALQVLRVEPVQQ
jgi:hypothetical protein